MSNKYAIIENNKVVNIIIADQDFIDEFYPNAILCAHAWIGASVDNGVIEDPQIPEVFLEEVEDIVDTPIKE